MKHKQKGPSNLDAFLSRHEKFVVSTHESPDWDGIGAALAFHEFLIAIGKQSIIINSDPTPEAVTFLDTAGDIHTLAEGYVIPDGIEEYAQFVLDTNDYDNIGSAYFLLKDRVKETFIIDHHEGGEEAIDDNYIKADASSCCEILYEIIESYGMPVSLRAAQALFAGIVFDTGSFIYPKTTPRTFAIASKLVEKGVEPFFIHEQIYEQNELSSFELRSKILSTMEIHYDHRLIAMKLTRKMLMDTGSNFAEGEPAINMPLTIRGVVASILVKQDINGPVKVSMRTKGDIDVAQLAMENGGGGHKNAAGYKSQDDLDEAYRQAIEKMGRYFT